MKLLCVSLVLITVSMMVKQAECADAAIEAPRFAVNMDEPAETRWNNVLSPYVSDFVAIEKWIDSFLPEWLQSLLVPIIADLDKFLPEPYADELRGVAKAANMELGKIIALNLIYDFSAACTSIVAQSSEGRIFHARNLDYGIPFLRNITVQVDFLQGGVATHSCTTFAGYIGCLTGVKRSGFSVSVDERTIPGSPLTNILDFFKGAKSVGLFLRSILASDMTYKSALTNVSDTFLMAPVYIIIAGTESGEGAVVTRNRTDANVWPLDVASGAWWRVETNYDHWEPVPPSDDRRDPANAGMKALGQQAVSLQGMYQVLSQPPVLNRGTKYTAMMDPLTGQNSSWIRWDAPGNVSLSGAEVWRI